MQDDPSLPDRDSVRMPLPWEKAAADAADPDSFLNWFKKTLAYRKTQPALLTGGFEVLGSEQQELFRFKRTAVNGDAVTFTIDFKTYEYSWS
jgi:glycosidase